MKAVILALVSIVLCALVLQFGLVSVFWLAVTAPRTEPVWELGQRLEFSEGLAPIYVYGGYCYVDEDGWIVIEPQFDYAGSFSGGLALVRINHLYGYIDDSGEYVLEPQFDDAGPFRNGRAFVKVAGEWVYIDKTGRRLADTQSDG